MCQYLDWGLNTIEPGILCKNFVGIPHACPSDHFGARFNVHQPLQPPLLPIIQPLLFKAEERRGRQTSKCNVSTVIPAIYTSAHEKGGGKYFKQSKCLRAVTLPFKEIC